MKSAMFLVRFINGLFVLLLMGLTTVQAQTQGPNGHFYKAVVTPGVITWGQARQAAEQSTFNGQHGYLATVTSSEEDQFIEQLRQQVAPQGYNALWVGGYQNPNSSRYEGWSWVNGEGPIPGFNGGETYANWQPDEPNDYQGTPENFLAVGHFGIFGWNDYVDGTQVFGYVVEYAGEGRASMVKVTAVDSIATESQVVQDNIDLAEFEFTRTGSFALDLPVFYSIHGTAVNGADYGEISKSTIIPAGEISVRLRIFPRADALAVVEPMETIGIRIEPSLILTPSATYDIDPQNREAAAVIYEGRPPQYPAMEIAVPRNGTVYEAGEPITIIAALYTTNDVSVIDMFGGGQSLKFVGTWQALQVPYETNSLSFYKFEWTNPPAGTNQIRGRAVLSPKGEPSTSLVNVVVKGPPAPPKVALKFIPNPPASGPVGDHATGYFEVSRTGSTLGDLQVFYSVTGTATAGTDYDALQGYAVIGSGRTTARINVLVKDDTLYETNETIILTLTPGNPNGTSGTSSNYAIDEDFRVAQMILGDDDPAPIKPAIGVTATPVEIRETNAVTGQIFSTIRVARTSGTNSELRVFLRYEGSALPGDDFTPAPTEVVIPAGKNFTEFQIRALDDGRYEGNESVTIRAVLPPENRPDLYPPQYEVVDGRSAALVRIIDANQPVSTFGVVAVRDGRERLPSEVTEPAVFLLQRTGPTNTSVSVNLAFQGAATPNIDYHGPSLVIAMAPGVTERRFEVLPVDDALVEPEETVIVLVSESADGKYLIDPARTQATLRIKDNDSPEEIPLIRVDTADFEATEFPFGSTETNRARFIISRSTGSEKPLQVFFSLHGTAKNGEDYQMLPASVTLQKDQGYLFIDVIPIPDQNSGGHKYEIVMEGGLSWPSAKSAAEQLRYNGVSGHLATITSRAEDEAIEQLRLEAGGPFLWAGGYQEPNEQSITDGWKWVNNEGSIPGMNGDGALYANWLPGEPNDYWGPASENYLLIGWQNTMGWNDQGQNVGAQGYIVEFDVSAGNENREKMETVAIRLEESPSATVVPPYAIETDHGQAGAVIFEHTPPADGEVEVAIPCQDETVARRTKFMAMGYHAHVDLDQMDWWVDGVKVGSSIGLMEDTMTGGVAFHQFIWEYSTPGRHVLRVTDSLGHDLSSSEIIFFVEADDNEKPTTQLVQPSHGASFLRGDEISVIAQASDDDGAITKIELLVDGSVAAATNGVGTLRVKLAPLPLGDHNLQARATDDDGATALSEPVRILVRHPDEVSFVKRELPETYAPGTAFKVELRANPPEGANAYAVEDQPPAGWPVSQISHEGAFDAINRKVKFGPFTDGEPRTLTYWVTPPNSATGRKTFTGNSAVNGRLYPIAGDEAVELMQQYHPADTDNNFAIVLSEATAYAAAWKSGLSWTTGPNPIPVSYVTKAHSIWQRGEGYRFEPSRGAAPACWISVSEQTVAAFAAASPSALRVISDAFQPGAATQVRVTVTPGSVASYALEEKPPRGWLISNISDEGRYDAATGTIRWGVYRDSTQRTFTYSVTPPVAVTSIGGFSGHFSCDGKLIEVTTGTVLPWAGVDFVTVNGPTPIEIVDCVRENGALSMHISGPAGQTAVIEGSSDFREWTEIQSIFIPDGVVEFKADAATLPDHRFFRLRVQ